MSTPHLKFVPSEIPRPDYAQPGANGIPRPRLVNGRRKLVQNKMKAEDLTRMRRACAQAREVLEEVLAAVKPGVSLSLIHI